MADFFGTDKMQNDLSAALGEQSEQATETAGEKVKVGEKEYTQDELNQLVSLGEIGRELESKWGTKIDRVYPEFTKKSQELSEAKTKLSEYERSQIESKQSQGVQLSPEELKRQALAEADNLGLVHSGNVMKFISDYMAGQQMLTDVNKIVDEASEKGIKTDAETILEHMQTEGFRNPNKAFKDLYEDQLDTWEEKQLKTLKPDALVTQQGSTAGGKTPIVEKITRDNLAAAVAAALNQGE